MKNLFLLIIAGLILLTLTPPAWAGFIFSPITHHLELPPGGRATLPLFVSNEGEREVVVEVRVAGLFLDPATGVFSPISAEQGSDLENASSFSCAAWLALREDRITLAPGQSVRSEILLRVPRNTPTGGYTAVIHIMPRAADTASFTPEGETSASVRITSSGVVPVFLEVRRPGAIRTRSGRYGEIESFEVVENENGLFFTATVANRGNTFFTASAQVGVFLEDSLRFTFPLGRGGAFIPPGQKVTLDYTIRPPYQPGNYRAEVRVDYGGFRGSRASFEFSVGRDKLERADLYRETEQRLDEPIYLAANQDSFTSRIVPGASRNFTVTLFNDSDEALGIESLVTDVADTESTQISQFVQVTPERFRIRPGARQNVRIVVSSPDPLMDGNKYARVLFRPRLLGEKRLEEDLAEIFAVPVFLILDNVRGERLVEGMIRQIDFNVVERENGNRYPRVNVLFQNSGNIHLQPSLQVTMVEQPAPAEQEGVVLVRPGEDTVVFQSSPAASLVLPGMEGMVAADSPRPLNKEITHYQVEVVLWQGTEEVTRETVVFEMSE